MYPRNFSGQPWSYQPQGQDPDGHALVFSLELAPEGMEIDTVTGITQWMPGADDAGTHDVQIRVADPDGLAATQAFTVSVLGAEPGITHEGTDFWLTFMKNYQADDDNNLSLFLSAREATTGTIEIPILNRSVPFSIAANSVEVFTVDDLAEVNQLSAQVSVVGENDGLAQTGIHVVADRAITVHGLNQRSLTSDGMLVLPTASLGTIYPIAGYVDRLRRNGDGAQVAVLAVTDETTITIELEHAVSPDGNAYATGFLDVGNTITKVLDRGESYFLGAHVPGSRVLADKPVAVFSGNQCASVPYGSTCDHLVEQMPPIDALGNIYYTQPFAWRGLGDLFQIFAVEDDTEIWLNDTLLAVLEQGRSIQTPVLEASVIQSNKPLLVSQLAYRNNYDLTERQGIAPADFSTDPMMVVLASENQYLLRYTFSTAVEKFRWNFVNVVVQSEHLATLRLDGNDIDTSLFQPIPGSNWLGASIPVEIGTHTLEADGAFGLTYYGYDVFDSYGFAAGANVSRSGLIGQLSINQVAAAAGVTGSETCVSVLAADAGGDSLGFAPVRVAITGANGTDDIAFTDASGVATYCYTGVLPGADSIVFSTGMWADTAVSAAAGTVTWELPASGNQAPVFVGNPSLYTLYDTQYNSTVRAQDPDGDSIEYSLLEAPVGLSIDSASGVLDWAVPADFEHAFFTVAATDATGASVQRRYRLSQDNGNTEPSIGELPVDSVVAYTNLEALITLQDPDRVSTGPGSFQGPGVSAYLENEPAGMTLQCCGMFGEGVSGTRQGATLRWTPRIAADSQVDV